MATKQAEYSRKYREKQRALGLCIGCNNTTALGSDLCEKHLQSRRLSQQRWLKRRAKQGRPEAEYIAMLNQQEGGCAICGSLPGGRRLAVDHDHETGKVRGLLCYRCNVGLGLFKDDVERLARAIEYLDRSH